MFFLKRSKQPSGAEWLIAGLGNPGTKYENTRHNAGFLSVDFLCSKLCIKANKLKFHGLYGTGIHAGHKIAILKPQTFMNLSGESVRDAAAFFGVPSERIIIIFDEASLAPGRLRIRRSGSDGGHNGIKNILYHLKTDVFPRVKIGVGSPPHPDFDMADWVLSRFSDSEMKVIVPAIEKAGLAALEIIENGIDSAMNKFNQASG